MSQFTLHAGTLALRFARFCLVSLAILMVGFAVFGCTKQADPIEPPVPIGSDDCPKVVLCDTAGNCDTGLTTW